MRWPAAAILFLTAVLGMTRGAFGSSDQWTAPTLEELSMTSIPEVPGASAVYLYREEVREDPGDTTVYVRIKILTAKGKEYGDIELPFGGDIGVRDLAGRTIHSDGSIIPFTGKPYEKLVEKEQGQKYKVKILSLPSVEVGSIVEYRYRWTGYTGMPAWYVQSNLFTRKAHYLFKLAAGRHLVWTEILPPGSKVQDVGKYGLEVLTLDVQDIRPLPHEDMMPPIDSVSFRVLFYSTTFKSEEEFWKTEGSFWSNSLNEFIGPGKKVSATVAALLSPSDTDEQKLRKIYGAVMALENTDFSRTLSAREKKANGLKDVKSTDDVLTAGRGEGDQLAALFVAMARAAGFKAYVMAVADRSERLFSPAYLSFGQLNDYVALVKVNDSERWFDPGERFCPFGELAWFHQSTGGLSQTDAGSELSRTPGAVYKDNHTSRLADLKIDEHGVGEGTVTLKWLGAAAMRWRQTAIQDDETSLKEALKSSAESMLPTGMEVQVTEIDDLKSFEKPLTVKFHVAGTIGSSTGKRLLLPASFFESQSLSRFTAPTREISIDMRYPAEIQDAVRYVFPESMAVESEPPASSVRIEGAAAFTTEAKQDKNSVLLYRNVAQARTIYKTNEYPALRELYEKLDAKDHETLVLTRAASTTDQGK